MERDKKEWFFRINKEGGKKKPKILVICLMQQGDDIFPLKVPLNIIIFLDVFGG